MLLRSCFLFCVDKQQVSKLIFYAQSSKPISTHCLLIPNEMSVLTDALFEEKSKEKKKKKRERKKRAQTNSQHNNKNNNKQKTNKERERKRKKPSTRNKQKPNQNVGKINGFCIISGFGDIFVWFKQNLNQTKMLFVCSFAMPFVFKTFFLTYAVGLLSCWQENAQQLLNKAGWCGKTKVLKSEGCSLCGIAN